MLFPRPACPPFSLYGLPGDRFPAAWCCRSSPGVPREDPNKKPGLYFPVYSIGFPSLSVQVMDTHPPKAAAMACSSFTVHPSRLNLLEKF